MPVSGIRAIAKPAAGRFPVVTKKLTHH